MHQSPAHHRTPRRLAAVGSAAIVAVSLVASDASAACRTSFRGSFAETATGAALGYDLHGTAKMTIGQEGTTVRIHVRGLDPDKDYGSHLHNGTCASGGGGHYQDVEGGATTPPNELWLTTSGTILEPNAGGAAHGHGSATWQARTTGDMTLARSVVVHEPGGARIACADLA